MRERREQTDCVFDKADKCLALLDLYCTETGCKECKFYKSNKEYVLTKERFAKKIKTIK